MQTLWQDLRYGARMLLKKPGFTLIAVLTLSLGIGANTAIFSLVDKLLLRSLPVQAPEQLVYVQAESVNPKFLNNIFSYPDYADYRAQNQALSGLLAYSQMPGRLGAGEQSEKVNLELVSGNYFDVLGVKPARGQLIQLADDKSEGGHPIAALSYGLWQKRFGGDPSVVGRTVLLNGVNYNVIGVAPAGFTGMRLEAPAQLWVPLTMRAQLLQSSVSNHERKLAFLTVFGRLKPGVTIREAQTSLDLLARNIREAITRDLKIHSLTEAPLPHFDLPALQHPYGNFTRLLVRTRGDAAAFAPAVRNEIRLLDPQAAVARVTTLDAELRNSIAPIRMAAALTSLFGIIALALAAIGLYSVMAYAVARRTREIGVRMALGAQPRDVLALVLREGLWLVLAGVAMGLAGAVALTRLIANQLYGVTATDPLTFAAVVALLAGIALLACWIPARRASQVDPMVALRCD